MVAGSGIGRPVYRMTAPGGSSTGPCFTRWRPVRVRTKREQHHCSPSQGRDHARREPDEPARREPDEPARREPDEPARREPHETATREPHEPTPGEPAAPRPPPITATPPNRPFSINSSSNTTPCLQTT